MSALSSLYALPGPFVTVYLDPASSVGVPNATMATERRNIDRELAGVDPVE